MILKAEKAHLSTSYFVIIALVMIIYYRPHFDNKNPRKTRDFKLQKRDDNDDGFYNQRITQKNSEIIKRC